MRLVSGFTGLGRHLLKELDITKFFPSWWFDSKCFQKGDETFFGSEESPSSLREARKYCISCPVSRECLTHAITQPEEYGIWAGTSARSREQMRSDIASGEWELDRVVDTVLKEGFKWRRR